MREKYESLALVQLKELAKVRGLKGTSAMKKAELVEAMLAEDERLKQLEESKHETRTEARGEAKSEPVRRPAPKKPDTAAAPGVRSETNYRAEASNNQRSDSAPRQETASVQAPRPVRVNEVYD